jgi:hypothetical protein
VTARVTTLGDPEAAAAPFRFRRGERVAWKRWDGSADPAFSGVVIEGICEYVPGGGAYRDRYVIRRSDGVLFGAGHLDLIRL